MNAFLIGELDLDNPDDVDWLYKWAQEAEDLRNKDKETIEMLKKQLNASMNLSMIYFTIASIVFGEDRVREIRDEVIEKAKADNHFSER